MNTIRIEYNFAWHYFAKKGEAARWHFMGQIYHREVAAVVEAHKEIKT